MQRALLKAGVASTRMLAAVMCVGMPPVLLAAAWRRMLRRADRRTRMRAVAACAWVAPAHLKVLHSGGTFRHLHVAASQTRPALRAAWQSMGLPTGAEVPPSTARLRSLPSVALRDLRSQDGGASKDAPATTLPEETAQLLLAAPPWMDKLEGRWRRRHPAAPGLCPRLREHRRWTRLGREECAGAAS